MIEFLNTLKSVGKSSDALIYVAPENFYKKSLHQKVLKDAPWELFSAVLSKTPANSKGVSLTTYTGQKSPLTFSVTLLPDKVSRYNTPSRRELIFQQLSSIKIGKSKKVSIVISLDHESSAPAICAAVSRLSCYYNRKLSSKETITVQLALTDEKGDLIKVSNEMKAIADSIAVAFYIVNTPPTEMNPESYAKYIRTLFAQNKNVTITEIKGKELVKHKLCGIYNVGKAANKEPRMIVIDYKPQGYKKTIALVGKGLTYDTGGLSLKINSGMLGMKNDLGGSAAVVAATQALVKNKKSVRVLAVLGIAENAISEDAYKLDDVITMHSGKMVEINNSDAEGRVVLADCMSFVGRKYKPDALIDIATLTGAQLMATGRYFAATIASDDYMEKLVVATGKNSGDLIVPLPFAPEFFEDELTSEIADMRNSVKDRSNAPTCGAAQFLYNHISDLNLPWIHIDMAGQAACTRGIPTGFGVSLLYELVQGI